MHLSLADAVLAVAALSAAFLLEIFVFIALGTQRKRLNSPYFPSDSPRLDLRTAISSLFASQPALISSQPWPAYP